MCNKQFPENIKRTKYSERKHQFNELEFVLLYLHS